MPKMFRSYVPVLLFICYIFIFPDNAFSELSYKGLSLNIGGYPSPTFLSVEPGVSLSYEKFNELRLALAFTWMETEAGEEGGHFGLTVGDRLSLARRISPLIGFSGTFYFSVDTRTDLYGNEVKEAEIAGAFYPEVGLSFWINDEIEIAVAGRYYFTVPSKYLNYWAINAGISFMIF